MKQLLFIFAAAMVLCACEKDAEEVRPLNPQQSFWQDKEKTSGDETLDATITRLYSVVFRQNLLVPTNAYVMELNKSRYFYMLRSKFGADLKVGDKISFKTSAKNPYEIAVINGYDLSGDEEASGGNPSEGIGYLFASDPIEGTVQGVFSMKVRYTIRLVEMVFIATDDGNLIYVRRDKLNIDLNPGDRIVYSVYTLVPNSVVELKKLRQ